MIQTPYGSIPRPYTAAPQPRFGSAAPLLLLGLAAAAKKQQDEGGYHPSTEPFAGEDALVNFYHGVRDVIDKIAGRFADRDLKALRAKDERQFHPYLKQLQRDFRNNLFVFSKSISTDRETEQKYGNVTHIVPVTYNGKPFELVQRTFGSGGAEYKLRSVAKTEHDGERVAETELTLYAGSEGTYAGYHDYSNGQNIAHNTNSKRGAQKAIHFFEELVGRTRLTFVDQSEKA